MSKSQDPEVQEFVDALKELNPTLGAGMEEIIMGPSARALVLRDAEKAVCNDRNAEYGEPIDNQRRISEACNALGYRGPGGRKLEPHDIPVIMALTKLARIVQSPAKADHWVDLAGYAAVGYELVTLEG